MTTTNWNTDLREFGFRLMLMPAWVIIGRSWAIGRLRFTLQSDFRLELSCCLYGTASFWRLGLGPAVLELGPWKAWVD